MKSTVFSLLILLILLFSLLIVPSTQENDLRQSHCDNEGGNYTKNSLFGINLNSILKTLPNLTKPNTYFYNLSTGNNNHTGTDNVFALALCRGDLSEECNSCLVQATQKITQECPNQKGAIVWFNGCTLRYWNHSLIGLAETRPEYTQVSPDNATDPVPYHQQLGRLLHDLQNKAAPGDSQRKFATGYARVGNFERVYALVECTPNLSGFDCWGCMDKLINEVPLCCNGTRGGLILRPSCDIRYDNYKYFKGNAEALLESSNATRNTADFAGKDSGSRKVVIIIVILAASLIAAATTILCILFRRRNIIRRKLLVASPDLKPKQEDGSDVPLHFDLITIKAATQNFSEANKLGQGGFGIVYKGRLEIGQHIAVKRLSRNSSGQGYQEFKNEVLLVTKLQHRNLVKILGFCLEKEEKLLVYEFVENTSLDRFLFDYVDPMKRDCLNWGKRYKIITGIARGMLYLHEDSRVRIIHRDLKASNILLDEDMNPKISDFGLAKLFDVDQTQGDMSKIAGTYGYMPPEYVIHVKFSTKSDVYSFGILLLEIITGQKCSGFHNGEYTEDLITFVWRNWRQMKAIDIIDPSLLTEARSEIIRCIHIGLLCIQNTIEDRPTMSSVMLMLSSQSVTMSTPSTPAFLRQNFVASNLHKPIMGSPSVNLDSVTDLSPR